MKKKITILTNKNSFAITFSKNFQNLNSNIITFYLFEIISILIT